MANYTAADVKKLYYAILQTQGGLVATEEALKLYRELDRVVTTFVVQQVALRADSLAVQKNLASSEHQTVVLRNSLATLKEQGMEFKTLDTTYFLGRETLIPSKRPGMALWREHLFSAMNRNARTATSFFYLPPNRVVELGAQIEL